MPDDFIDPEPHVRSLYLDNEPESRLTAPTLQLSLTKVGVAEPCIQLNYYEAAGSDAEPILADQVPLTVDDLRWLTTAAIPAVLDTVRSWQSD